MTEPNRGEPDEPQLPRFERNDYDNSVTFFLEHPELNEPSEKEVRVSLRGTHETRTSVTMWLGEDGSTLTAPIVGNILTETFRENLVKSAGAKWRDDYNRETDAGQLRRLRLREDLDNIARAFEHGVDESGESVRDLVFRGRGPSVSERVLHYASEHADYFHDADGDGYATVRQDLHRETWPLRSRGFRRWLRYRYYSEEKARLGGIKEPAPLKDALLSDVLNQLEAKANFEGLRVPVSMRIAEAGGSGGSHSTEPADGSASDEDGSASDAKIYVDLCDRKWRVVEVTPDGWRVLDEHGIKFIRAKGMQPLPVPQRTGNPEAALGILRDMLNLAGEEGERSWSLILAWLLQAFRGRGPYPVLVLLGERGSAKTTAARILRSLVDPSTVPLRSVPRSPHEVYIDAVSSWVVAIDNISTLPPWLSDTLCQLSTGGGFTTRTLFTDRDQELFSAMRPVIVNGISDVATRDDLVQRALIVRLPSIPKGHYRPEREIYAELRAARPQILGALLNAASVGLLEAPQTEVKAPPRMADFARWATATEAVLGGEPGSFMEAYGYSDREGTHQALEASALSTPLWSLANEFAKHGGWVGTAKEMLKRLGDDVDDDVRRSREWPQAPNALSRQLKRLGPLFREVGIRIEELPRESGTGAKKWLVVVADDDAS